MQTFPVQSIVEAHCVVHVDELQERLPHERCLCGAEAQRAGVASWHLFVEYRGCRPLAKQGPNLLNRDKATDGVGALAWREGNVSQHAVSIILQGKDDMTPISPPATPLPQELADHVAQRANDHALGGASLGVLRTARQHECRVQHHDLVDRGSLCRRCRGGRR